VGSIPTSGTNHAGDLDRPVPAIDNLAREISRGVPARNCQTEIGFVSFL
jgi:hypothetical protein